MMRIYATEADEHGSTDSLTPTYSVILEERIDLVLHYSCISENLTKLVSPSEKSHCAFLQKPCLIHISLKSSGISHVYNLRASNGHPYVPLKSTISLFTRSRSQRSDTNICIVSLCSPKVRTWQGSSACRYS